MAEQLSGSKKREPYGDLILRILLLGNPVRVERKRPRVSRGESRMDTITKLRHQRLSSTAALKGVGNAAEAWPLSLLVHYALPLVALSNCMRRRLFLPPSAPFCRPPQIRDAGADSPGPEDVRSRQAMPEDGCRVAGTDASAFGPRETRRLL
jgi:hypothetical protein